MPKCPSCYENKKELLGCAQCGSTFCRSCQPHWDYTGEICGGCQESNSIAAFKEESHTARLRRWFTKKAKPVVGPELGRHPLPWRVVQGSGDQWFIASGPLMVAEFDSKAAADWACTAANQHLPLKGLAVQVHDRIRAGEQWFDGGEDDCRMWLKLREVLK